MDPSEQRRIWRVLGHAVDDLSDRQIVYARQYLEDVKSRHGAADHATTQHVTAEALHAARHQRWLHD